MYRQKLTVLLLLLSGAVLAQSLTKGIELYQDGKPDAARAFFANNSNNAEAIYYLGRISFDEEDYRKAADYFEEAIELNDRKSDYHTWYGNAVGSYAGEVNFFRQGILAPKIKAAYEKAVSLNPKNVDAQWGLIEYYTQAPGVLGGSWEKAEATANVIKGLDVLEGHSAFATVYERQEEFEKAEKEYIAAAEVDEGRLLNLGFYYQGREQYEKAFSTFESVYAKDTNDLRALYQLGKTSALSGKQTSKGIKSLRTYLSREWQKGTPSHAGALMRLGMIYEKMGKNSDAIKHYESSLSKDPEMRQAKDGLSRLQ
ncbi:MAG: tetratricopeptide repeat protein [Cyclobacteriaceae bacterium]